MEVNQKELLMVILVVTTKISHVPILPTKILIHGGKLTSESLTLLKPLKSLIEKTAAPTDSLTS